MLFNRGKAISGAPINIGTNQLPKPPIKTGITIKKIIKKACAVTTTLYSWWFPKKNWFPGYANSKRINKDNKVPIIPEKIPKMKYNVPISLWFVEKSHLWKKGAIILKSLNYEVYYSLVLFSFTPLKKVYYSLVLSSFTSLKKVYYSLVLSSFTSLKKVYYSLVLFSFTFLKKV